MSFSSPFRSKLPYFHLRPGLIALSLIFGTTFTISNSVSAGETLSKLQKEIKQLIDSCKVSVVTVTSKFSHDVYVEKESGILSLFKTEVERQALSYVNIGTGIVIDGAGYILTRSSIVRGAESNTITLASGKEIQAKFIGHDETTGFAVLRGTNFQNLIPARLGNSDEIAAGSGIVMIGNSLGTFPSVVVGNVSAVMNDGTMQISANLNPGKNGSPILDFNGQVIGLVAGRLNAQENMPESSTGFHYNESTLVYPVNWIKRIVDDIIQYGYVRKGWLGVVGYHDGKKARIRSIKENSPAEQGGLIEGDVILSYSSRDVNDIGELARLVESTRPGNRVSVEFARADEILQREIEIGEKQRQNEAESGFQASAGRRIDRKYSSGQKISDLIARNRALEHRLEALEKELITLKKLIESK